MTIKLTTDRAAVVDTSLKWIPITHTKPPGGAKVLLINRRLGAATMGTWHEGNDWTHWQALPTFDDAEVQ